MTEKQRQELCERFSQIFAVANPDPNVPFEKFIYDAILKAFIAGAEYAWNNPSWISVEDELPEVGASVLFVHPDESETMKGYITRIKTWWSEKHRYSFEKVTHWMSLPQLPRKEDKK